MKFLRLALAASLPLLSSCALLVGTGDAEGGNGPSGSALQQLQESEQKAVLEAARARLERTSAQVDAGEFTAAEATLAPLANSSLFPAEVADLKAKIALGRERQKTSTVQRQLAVARRLALRDEFDEAEAILDSLDANGVCKEDIRDVRELVNLRRIEMPTKAATKQVAEARRFIQRGNLETAEALIAGIESGGAVPREVARLKAELAQARTDAGLEIDKAASANQAITEVEERYVLPGTYNKTVVISPSLEPIEMPVGSMEDLVNKKVTIELDNAGVKELVQVLSQVDGLNIIADDALEAESNLTINVRNVPLKEVLSYIARNMGVAFHLGENMIWVTQSLEEPGTGPKLETRLFQLRQGFIPSIPGGAGAQEDTDLEDALDAVLADSPEGASFRVFKTRNVLMVRDTIENLRLVEEMINTFDKPPYQVSIEARFLTISRDDLRDVGSEFAVFADAAPVVGDANAQMQVTSLLSTLGALASTDADGNVSVSTENGAAVGSFGGVIGNRAYSLLISALDKKNSTKNLSAPRVTVLNNRTAQIRRGSKILYYSELETVASNGGEETGNGNVQTALTGDPEELELGVTLGVKVNVGNDGNTILLGLYPEVVELLRWRAFNVVADGGTDSNNNDNGDSDTSGSGTIELPETSESYVQTAVRVKNGQTVALGGLVSSNTSKTVSKVPILGDIPLLGFFFRHTNETTEPQHLLIFVTAKVIDENGSSVQVAE